MAADAVRDACDGMSGAISTRQYVQSSFGDGESIFDFDEGDLHPTLGYILGSGDKELLR